MKIVNLSNEKGQVKRKYVGYSFLFLFFGPFYLMSKLRFISGILLLLLYYYLLPLPGMEMFVNIITTNMSLSVTNILSRILLFFRTEYARFAGIGIVILLQLFLSIFMEGLLLRKQIKKQNILPITEEDARLLISVFACNRKIKLAMSKDSSITSYEISLEKKIKDVPYIINEENETSLSLFKKQEKRHKIAELTDLYNLGQMTREEYEIRRAEIVKKYQ